MHHLGFSRRSILTAAAVFVLGSCGDDDQTGDGGSSAPTSNDESTAGTSAGPGAGSESETTQSSTASGDGSSATTLDSSSGDGSSTDAETTNASTDSSTDTGEICACTDDLPACNEEFSPGGECGRSSNERCCHTDGPYTCICPFAPPCEWTKDDCR